MASIYLTSTAPRPDDALAHLRRSAQHDPFGQHTLTDDPEHATLILFAESWDADWLLRDVRAHPLVRRYREKCFVVCEQDLVAHTLPGVYANVTPLSARSGRVRQGCYLWMYANPFVEHAPTWPSDPYLYSFVGSLTTSPVRERLRALSHPRGYVRDTAAESPTIWWEASAEDKAQFRRTYAEELRQAAFVLCPRGISPSTVRLYETMKTGRVPVILADDWVPPDGPDWEAFSLRVPEDRVADLPALLSAREADAPAMGRRARAAWEAWFSPRVHFHRVVEWCLDIRRTRPTPECIGRLAGYGEIALSPVFLRRLLRDLYTRGTARLRRVADRASVPTH